MVEAKLSILLFMFSRILSLVATFLDNPSISLDCPAINSLKGGNYLGSSVSVADSILDSIEDESSSC